VECHPTVILRLVVLLLSAIVVECGLTVTSVVLAAECGLIVNFAISVIVVEHGLTVTNAALAVEPRVIV